MSRLNTVTPDQHASLSKMRVPGPLHKLGIEVESGTTVPY
jgi:hypothetical protein